MLSQVLGYNGIFINYLIPLINYVILIDWGSVKSGNLVWCCELKAKLVMRQKDAQSSASGEEFSILLC